MGPKIVSACFERPNKRPAGTPKTAPIKRPINNRAVESPSSGNIFGMFSTRAGQVAKGVGNAGEHTANAQSHQSTITAILPNIRPAALRILAAPSNMSGIWVGVVGGDVGMVGG